MRLNRATHRRLAAHRTWVVISQVQWHRQFLSREGIRLASGSLA
jgi:hypothetical protein